MFNSTVLEVAIGLTFCYAALALIVSSLQEALTSITRLRARTLLAGVKTMLNDPNFQQLARALYTHALVNPHDDGRGGDDRSIKTKPSYIEPANFAAALIDTIQTLPGDYAQLGRDIDALPDPQVRLALQGMHQRAGGSMERFRDAVAGWFDTAMARVSGTYKRRSLMTSFLLSLLVAMLFNIDSIHLFRTLWQHPTLAAHLGTEALKQDVYGALATLPVGWQHFPPAYGQELALKLAGWLLTASTALFGAPFWFDLLQRTVRMRGTGEPPEKRQKDRSAPGPVGVDQAL
jgi:hypothetical protein